VAVVGEQRDALEGELPVTVFVQPGRRDECGVGTLAVVTDRAGGAEDELGGG